MHRHSHFSFASLTVALGFGLAAASAWAHHGWSSYTREPFQLTGIVVETHFGYPHDRLTVESDGQRWNVVMSPPRRSRRAGFDESIVQAGNRITAFGNRHEDPNVHEMKTARIQVEGNDYDLYPSRL